MESSVFSGMRQPKLYFFLAAVRGKMSITAVCVEPLEPRTGTSCKPSCPRRAKRQITSSLCRERPQEAKPTNSAGVAGPFTRCCVSPRAARCSGAIKYLLAAAALSLCLPCLLLDCWFPLHLLAHKVHELAQDTPSCPQTPSSREGPLLKCCAVHVS